MKDQKYALIGDHWNKAIVYVYRGCGIRKDNDTYYIFGSPYESLELAKLAIDNAYITLSTTIK